MKETTKEVLLVDDHPLFREGLKTILRRDRDYSVAGEAGTAAEAMDLLHSREPDMAVVDVSLPDASGIRLVRDARRRRPDLAVLMVSMHSRLDLVAEAFQAGALGYLVKESAAEGLLKGLNIIASGGYFLDSSLSPRVVEDMMHMPRKTMGLADEGFAGLTPREQEVMRFLAEGLTCREIAGRLYISVKTVENHRSNLMRKLDLDGPMDLLRYAARLGIVDLEG
jgi:DNA-binding NarL/FixJ family response regulator